jgi:hypothetical protein
MGASVNNLAEPTEYALASVAIPAKKAAIKSIAAVHFKARWFFDDIGCSPTCYYDLANVGEK